MESASRTTRRLRWGTLLTVVSLVVVAAVPMAVLAVGGTFVDDDTSVFEGDIEWLAASGVTKGCNPPVNDRFCPDDEVTRGQMAAFMRRFAQYLGAEDGIVNAADSAATAATAQTADDAAMLAGAGPEAYTNPVFGVSLERDFTRTGILAAGVTAEIVSIDFESPTAGFIALDYYASFQRQAGDTALIVKVAVDDTSCATSIDASSAYTAVEGGFTDFDTAAGTLVLETTAGTHTYTLCGGYRDADAAVVTAAIDGTFSTGESALVPLVVGAEESGGSDFD